MSNILIVEDSIVNRQILKKMLEQDYDLIEAVNGQEALDILKDNWINIDLILLDIVMPVMDGYAFLSALKNYPDYQTIPIIVTTSNDSDKDEVNALAKGATDFIRKPYHFQIVKHRITNIITLRHTAAMFNLIKYDQLTGLFSKEYFYKMAAEEMGRNSDNNYDIICCDIENFSLVNDIYGYDVGNQILKSTAMTLKKSLVGNIICTRLNSDIFVALMPYRNDYTEDYFNNLTSEINNNLILGEIVLDYGIYHCTDNDTTIHTACNRALSVIDKVKGNFTKNFVMYDEAFRQEQLLALRLTANIEKALKNREFKVYLQPKFDLQTEKMIGAEALVRWISPEDGFMPPGKFIPLFERNGFISELDKFVWEESCAFLRKSIDNNWPRLPISVNVSRIDLYNLDVVKVVTDLINKYKLETKDLHLEITETAYNDHPEIVLEATNRLHETGYVLELDDFGTGYSSLNLLSEMALDILKLDMRFAQSHVSNQKQNDIMSFILDLAKRMKLTVISEGVETLEQTENLKKMGCNSAQGYYFAKPMPINEYEVLLAKQAEEQ
ncbi:MAG: EAL domain-containing protein [Suipraeoptans sp.]